MSGKIVDLEGSGEKLGDVLVHSLFLVLDRNLDALGPDLFHHELLLHQVDFVKL